MPHSWELERHIASSDLSSQSSCKSSLFTLTLTGTENEVIEGGRQWKSAGRVAVKHAFKGQERTVMSRGLWKLSLGSK